MEIFPGSSLPADAQEFARRAQRDGGAPVDNQLRKPPLWLKPGDVVEVDISGIGVLSNPIVAEE